MAQKFKKNDNVLVIAGSEKGKKGLIKSIYKNRVIIEGINLATIHKKPTQSSSGQIIKVEKSIHISNISHMEDGNPVKISFSIEDGNGKKFVQKSRISKKTNKKID